MVFTQYMVLISECRPRLVVYASFAVAESHLKERTTLKELALRFHFPSLRAFEPFIVHQNLQYLLQVGEKFVRFKPQTEWK